VWAAIAGGATLSTLNQGVHALARSKVEGPCNGRAGQSGLPCGQAGGMACMRHSPPHPRATHICHAPCSAMHQPPTTGGALLPPALCTWPDPFL
jgi:hypothetical protein